MKLKTKDNVTLVIIVILFVIAIGLGVAILKQGAFKKLFGSPTGKEQGKNGQTVNKTARAIPPGITQDEKKVYLAEPGANATSEEKKLFSEYASKAAKKTDTLDITSCIKPNPAVISLILGQDLIVANNDTHEHQFSLGSNRNYVIGAGEKKKIAINFDSGSGVYGYFCNYSVVSAGFINVILQ